MIPHFDDAHDQERQEELIIDHDGSPAETSILLLDFNAPAGLGVQLQELLTSSPSSAFDLRYEPFSLDAGELSDELEDEVSSTVSTSGADLIFLVLPPGVLKSPGALLRAVGLEPHRRPVVAVLEAGEPNELIRLLRLGVSDFVTPPLKSVDIIPRIWRLLGQCCQEQQLLHSVKERLGLSHLVGESPAFLAAINRAALIANCDANVMIAGETGTGKELFARSVHYLSPRANKPFIPVNCGAIPVDLIENELFGHERGAYTGAAAAQPGLIQTANGGTIFLDEIDSLPLLAQVKLLRFLQEKEFRPLGSTRTIKADVRVIAASNADLEEAVRAGKLRQDLYYRLNVIPITLPALRERREDIPLLARYFLEKYAGEFAKHVTGFSLDAMQLLVLYEWPGNVRELEHVIERAVVLSSGPTIGMSEIFLPTSHPAAAQKSFNELKAAVVEQFERTYIKCLLLAYSGNITKAAEAARKNRRAFWQLIRKHKIRARDYRAHA